MWLVTIGSQNYSSKRNIKKFKNWNITGKTYIFVNQRYHFIINTLC